MARPFFFFIFLFFIILPVTVYAHALPVQYVPDAYSILQSPPSQVTINFSERVEKGTSSIIILSPNGSQAQNGNAQVSPTDPRLLSVALNASENGTYSVTWQVVSADDGHFTRGAYAFSIGNESPTLIQVVQVGASSTMLEATTLGIELLGQSLLIGLLVLFAFLWIKTVRCFPELKNDDTAIRRRLTVLAIVGVALIIIGVVSFLVFKATEVEQGEPGGFFAAFTSFAVTLAGVHSIYRALFAIIFLLCFIRWKDELFNSVRWKEWFLFTLVGLMGLSRARVSHAAAATFHPAFSVFINFIHLISKEFWAGGLIVLTLVFLPLLTKHRHARVILFLLTQVSKLVTFAFGFFAVSGIYIIWLHLKSPTNLLTTDWGIRFIALAIGVGILLLVRLYHQLIVERKALRACMAGKNAHLWLSFTLPLECLLGIGVLFITSILIITTPPLPATSFFHNTNTVQGISVTFQEYPYDSSVFLITTSQSVNNLLVTLNNVDKNIGPLNARALELYPRAYAFDKKLMEQTGTWKVTVVAQRKDAYDATTIFLVDIPITTFSVPESFGFFEATLLILVLGSVILTIGLYQFTKRLNQTCIGITLPKKCTLDTSFKTRDWIAAIIVALLLGLALFWAYNTMLKSDFERTCESYGDTWQYAAPMLNGKVLSSTTTYGCMTTSTFGQSLFADSKQYTYYAEMRSLNAHHH